VKTHHPERAAAGLALRARRLVSVTVTGAVLAIPLAACRAPRPPHPTPEARADLSEWWARYKESFILPEGRVVRPRDGNDTVSEGQAYALIAAALLGDRETFDRVRAWTERHLSRRERFGDHLLAWHWRDGDVCDWNPSSDADVDYAMALLLAHERWKNEALRAGALALAADIRREEVTSTRLGPLLAPGTWGRNSDGSLTLNPSYFAPAAFRMLGNETGDPIWGRMASSSYAVWLRSARRLGRQRGVGLPPDWCALQPDGALVAAPGRAPTFGWEALRVPMRAGLDALIHDSPEPRRFLRRTVIRFFRAQLRDPQTKPAAVYSYWGAPADPSESLAMTAMVLFAFQAAEEPPPPQLVAVFDRQRQGPAFLNDYYAQSLTFYPLAFRAGLLTPQWVRQTMPRDAGTLPGG